MIRTVLIHRYDNAPDIMAVPRNQCSDVLVRAKEDNFSMVIIVPTRAAKITRAIVADATSGQYVPTTPKHWPGRPADYCIRVDLENFRYTTVDKVQRELERVGKTWAAQWQVTSAEIELNNLF